MTVASLCYTLEVWLISNTTGETISMGTNFPFWVSTDVTTGEQIGIFGYDGLAQGFPFPTDSGFFGNIPQPSTFSVKFKNTGLPFTFWTAPQGSVTIDLDSGNTGSGQPVNSVLFDGKSPRPRPVGEPI
jgi:hypothetical protein